MPTSNYIFKDQEHNAYFCDTCFTCLSITKCNDILKYPYVTNKEPNNRKYNNQVSESEDALDYTLIELQMTNSICSCRTAKKINNNLMRQHINIFSL